MVNGAAVDESVTVVVDKFMTIDVSLLLGEVEPDVRLNMTLPACTGNGEKLPRVWLKHVPDEELPGPQQKDESDRNGVIVTP